MLLLLLLSVLVVLIREALKKCFSKVLYLSICVAIKFYHVYIKKNLARTLNGGKRNSLFFWL